MAAPAEWIGSNAGIFFWSWRQERILMRMVTRHLLIAQQGSSGTWYYRPTMLGWLKMQRILNPHGLQS